MTLQQRYQKGFEVLGFEVDSNNRSRKYIKMVNAERTYWLGKSGAVRFGRTSSDSQAASEYYKKKILLISKMKRNVDE
jgi:hypothetical protein